MKFASELQVESILSVDSNAVIETTNISKDSGNRDLKTCTNVESVTEELIPEAEVDKNKDINGKEEFSPDKDLNELLLNLYISNSDENYEDGLSKLRERGKEERRSTNSKYRTNYLDKTEKYDRSQINRNSVFEQKIGPHHHFASNKSPSFILDESQTIPKSTSNGSEWAPLPGYFEDIPRANSVGSPESWYGLSLADSPPTPSVNQNLDVFPEFTNVEPIHSQNITDLIVDLELLLKNSPECALTDHSVLNHYVNDAVREEETILKIIKDLENTPNDLSDRVEFGGPRSFKYPNDDNEDTSSSNITEHVPVTGNPENNSTKKLEYNYDVLSHYVDDSVRAKERINEIIKILENTPNDLSDRGEFGGAWSFKCPNDDNDDTSSSNITYHVPVTENSEKNTTKRLEYKLENKAKRELRKFLSVDKLHAVLARIYRQINEDIVENREIKIIRVVDEMDKMSENRTNLHEAVLKQNIEEIYGIVEIQKQYQKPFSDINIRDKYRKTALDYAIQNKMTLVVDYLKENTACQSVNI